MNSREIKRLIADGQIEKAIQLALEIVELSSDTQLKNEIIYQSSRLKRVVKDKHSGLITSQDAEVTINNLTSSFLLLIDEAEFLGDPKSSIKNRKLIFGLSTEDFYEYTSNHSNILEVLTLKCSNCDFNFLHKDETPLIDCPVCGKDLSASKIVQDQMLRPFFTIPFNKKKVENKDIIEWLSSKNKSKDEVVEKLTSLEYSLIYIPSFFISTIAEARSTFSQTIMIPKTVSQGTESQTTYENIKQMYQNNEYQIVEGNIMVASDIFSNQTVGSILGFDIAKYQEIETVSFDEYNVECVKINYQRLITRFKDSLSKSIKTELKKANRTKALESFWVEFTDTRLKYVLIPIIRIIYEFDNEVYVAFMNGQTGSLDGEYPNSESLLDKIFSRANNFIKQLLKN